MKNYFATFGMGHDQQGYIQPIQAKDENEAHKLMFSKYGPKFAFIYDEEQFQQELEDGFHTDKEHFKPLIQEVT